MRYLSLLGVLCGVATASAQDIEGPEEVPEHRLVRLELTGLEEGDSAIWDAFAMNGAEADGLASKGGGLYVFTGPPGRYRVSVTYLTGGTLGQDRQYVTIGDAPDPPGPEPGPGPNPPEPEPLSDLSKEIRDAADGVESSIVAKAANAYGAQVSAINAGAYEGDALEAAKQAISEAIADANPPREDARAMFDAIDAALQERENDGALDSLDAIADTLNQISLGLEAAR